jgi:hypothetical protein
MPSTAVLQRCDVTFVASSDAAKVPNFRSDPDAVAITQVEEGKRWGHRGPLTHSLDRSHRGILMAILDPYSGVRKPRDTTQDQARLAALWVEV